MKHFRYLLPLFISGFLVACNGNPTKPDDAESGASGALSSSGTSDSESSSVGIEDQQGVMLDELDDPENPLSVRIIYFEYDSAEVSQDSL